MKIIDEKRFFQTAQVDFPLKIIKFPEPAGYEFNEAMHRRNRSSS